MLDRINARRDNRNNFFHNHEQSGLTVNQEKCLQAFLDLYKMMKFLFGRNFTQAIQANSVVKAQIILMKLRARSYKTSIVNNHFYQIANTRGNINVMPNSFAYDLCFLNEDAETFIVKIQGYFEVEIQKIQDKIDRISNLRKQNKNHIKDLNKYNSEINLLKSIIDECLS
ncbi:hypothetical protein H1P_230043 [Hyella patelloides LEGE 07179]|uniref:Uncharacterized protein n=1 Tax=Hyella patelloides LEGE 07179 TaxID=945734 RepID=A0A563VRF3_9CYAN|nr:hypothetical protein [Hyella patelloides]VEP13979.1 hypothetical protein H1P_230043 [Hyella patelloides LEGE 07179]